jgi:hypothetical protein
VSWFAPLPTWRINGGKIEIRNSKNSEGTMYGMGETPLILQGAAQRETLSPDQLSRLGVSPANTAINVSSVVLPLAAGVVAAFFLAGGSKHRSLF